MKITHAVLGATMTWLLAISSTHAGYICTGASTSANGNGNYFNGDLTDANDNCGEDELTAAGIIFDPAAIVGSKTDSINEPITSWDQDEFGLGTLTITEFGDEHGTWTLTGAGAIEPLFFVVKYDSGYDLYSYMGTGTPFSDDWTGDFRGTIGETCRPSGDVNCNAAVSHVSVYGEVPIPAAAWLFGSGLIGLVGIAKRRKS